MSDVRNWREAPVADFAVIGDPVTHSLSPKMHSAAFHALGLPYRYVAIHVERGEVAEALRHMEQIGYRGANVTVPHKEEALDWAQEAEPFALKVRAANTLNLKRRSCINTDAPGFLDTLRDLPIPEKTALLIGAGGSARAIATALAEDGWKLRVQNRTHERAEELARAVGAEAVRDLGLEGEYVIINCTSASLGGSALAIDWSVAPRGAIAYDLMYSPNGTPFLNAARAHGIRTIDGLDLLVAQGARSFEWWLGIQAPRKAMREALG